MRGRAVADPMRQGTADRRAGREGTRVNRSGLGVFRVRFPDPEKPHELFQRAGLPSQRGGGRGKLDARRDILLDDFLELSDPDVDLVDR